LHGAGSYCEMYTFVSPSTPLLPKRPSNPNAAFIVSAFKTAGNLDSLDRSREQSGPVVESLGRSWIVWGICGQSEAIVDSLGQSWKVLCSRG